MYSTMFATAPRVAPIVAVARKIPVIVARHTPSVGALPSFGIILVTPRLLVD